MKLSRPLSVLLLACFGLTNASNGRCTEDGSPEAKAFTPSMSRIVKALCTGGRLWLLLDGGRLITIDLPMSQPGQQSFAGPVVDLDMGDDELLWMLHLKAPGSCTVVARRCAKGNWSVRGEVDFMAGERIVGLQVLDGRPLILTTARLLRSTSAGWTSLRVKMPLGEGDPLDPWLQTSLAVTSDGSLYVGLNHGEWGGGLRRVDLATGDIETIRDVPENSEDLCEGKLNPACDPVTSLAVDPANGSCLLAGVGLRHFLEEGRILRVCRESVTPYFEKAYPPAAAERGSEGGTPPEERQITQMEGVFGMAAGKNGVWAVTGGGVYHIDGPGKWHRFQMPELDEYGDLQISTAIPGLVVLATDVNWANSVSGMTPLIAACDR